jgi:hypothetical protein
MEDPTWITVGVFRACGGGLLVAAAMTEASSSRRPRAGGGEPGGSNRMSGHKAHSLIGRVYDRRNLARAWERVKKNKGAGGIDRVTVDRFEANRDHYLDLLHERLKTGRYRPRPVSPGGDRQATDHGQAAAGYPDGGGILPPRPVTIGVSSSSLIRFTR